MGRHLPAISLLSILILTIFGCSGGGGSPAIPDSPAAEVEAALASSHALWGFWTFAADPDAGTIDVVEHRAGDLHLNALRFLEPPALLYLTLESAPQFNGNVLTIDIGLRHPFLGEVVFTGFDVRGIMISDGSLSGFDNPDLLIPGQGDTRLLNADGLTRWWNPTEFPYNAQNPIFGYIDGLLGTPDSTADFTATLNGYKYFTNNLDPDESIDDINPDGRGIFSAGQKNVRRYVIKLESGLVFNYAVDASWVFPTGDPPYDVPDDFPQAANSPEAWNIIVTELDNTLYNDGVDSGGELHLDIRVYDWFKADLNTLRAEAPGNFNMAVSDTPTDGGTGYSTYQLDILNAYPVTAGELDILISVDSNINDYGGLLPGEPVASYWWHTTTVSDTGPQVQTHEWPLYHFDTKSTGYNPAEDDLAPPLEIYWSQNHGGGPIFFSPVVAEEKVFYVNCSSDTLRAVDWETGTEIWEADVDPNDETSWGYWCGPAYHDGHVFAGGVNAYCFDADDGTQEWEYVSSQNYVFGSIMVADGVVFLPGRYGRLEAVDETDGSHLWDISTGDTFVGCFWITCGDDLVYTGGSTNGEVYARQKLAGTGGWMTIGPDPGPTSYNDRSFRNAGAVDENGYLYSGNYSRNFYKFNGATGAIEWTYELGNREPFNACCIYDDCVFFGSVAVYGSQVPDEALEGALYAVNLDGSERFIFPDPHGGFIQHDPVASGGYIWVGSSKGWFYAIDAATGALEWEMQLSSSAINSGSAIANNRIYTGDTGGTIYCLRPVE